jgi:hypothetical protein
LEADFFFAGTDFVALDFAAMWMSCAVEKNRGCGERRRAEKKRPCAGLSTAQQAIAFFRPNSRETGGNRRSNGAGGHV